MTAKEIGKQEATVSAIAAAGATREALRIALDAAHSAMSMTPVPDEIEGLGDTARRLAAHLERHRDVVLEWQGLARKRDESGAAA
jgi:hypothetical protein